MPPRIPKTDEQRVEIIPNFRPFLGKLAIPEADICAAPAVCYSINIEWNKYFLSLLQVLDQLDIWDSEDPDEIRAARGQVRELSAMGSCICGYPAASYTINIAINTSLRLSYRQIFLVDGLDGVAPDRPDTFFDEDTGDTGGEIEQRKVALCWAVHDYINTVVDAGLFNADVIDVEIILGAAAISFLMTPVAGVLYLVGVEVIIILINAVARGDNVVSDVACCMLDGLTGVAITEANFALALEDCTFGPLTDAGIVAAIIGDGLSDQGNFLSFVAALGGYMGATDLLSECPCPREGCRVDFTIDDGGFDPQPGPLAIYDAGVGWDNGPSGPSNHRIHIQYDFSEDIAITAASFKIAFTGVDDLQWELYLYDGAIELHHETTVTGPEQTEVAWTFSEVAGVTRYRITIVKVGGLLLDFEGHIIETEYTGDICDFPDQS